MWQIVHAAVRETLGKTGAVPMMDFDEAPGVEIPVLRQGPCTESRGPCPMRITTLFAREYVDHAAPQPEVEFAGFDVPYGGAVPPSNVFREVASSFGTPALHEVPGDADDEVFESAAFGGSELEFIPSASDEPQQQRLELDGKPRLSDVVPVGGGLAVARYGGRLVAADLRRARERVLYENYLVLLGNGSSVSQQLLFPSGSCFPRRSSALMEENAVEFAGLGFDVDYCGGGAVEVRGTPADMPADAIDRLLYELLQAFDTPHDLADVRREKIARVMARNAARTAQRFTAAEAAALLDQLGACGDCSFAVGQGRNGRDHDRRTAQEIGIVRCFFVYLRTFGARRQHGTVRRSVREVPTRAADDGPAVRPLRPAACGLCRGIRATGEKPEVRPEAAAVRRCSGDDRPDSARVRRGTEAQRSACRHPENEKMTTRPQASAIAMNNRYFQTPRWCSTCSSSMR